VIQGEGPEFKPPVLQKKKKKKTPEGGGCTYVIPATSEAEVGGICLRIALVT
jgi:hypothetical protein